MKSIYVLGGWEGTTSDSRILKMHLYERICWSYLKVNLSYFGVLCVEKLLPLVGILIITNSMIVEKYYLGDVGFMSKS